MVTLVPSSTGDDTVDHIESAGDTSVTVDARVTADLPLEGVPTTVTPEDVVERTQDHPTPPLPGVVGPQIETKAVDKPGAVDEDSVKPSHEAAIDVTGPEVDSETRIPEDSKAHAADASIADSDHSTPPLPGAVVAQIETKSVEKSVAGDEDSVKPSHEAAIEATGPEILDSDTRIPEESNAHAAGASIADGDHPTPPLPGAVVPPVQTKAVEKPGAGDEDSVKPSHEAAIEATGPVVDSDTRIPEDSKAHSAVASIADSDHPTPPLPGAVGHQVETKDVEKPGAGDEDRVKPSHEEVTEATGSAADISEDSKAHAAGASMPEPLTSSPVLRIQPDRAAKAWYHGMDEDDIDSQPRTSEDGDQPPSLADGASETLRLDDNKSKATVETHNRAAQSTSVETPSQARQPITAEDKVAIRKRIKAANEKVYPTKKKKAKGQAKDAPMEDDSPVTPEKGLKVDTASSLGYTPVVRGSIVYQNSKPSSPDVIVVDDDDEQQEIIELLKDDENDLKRLTTSVELETEAGVKSQKSSEEVYWKKCLQKAQGKNTEAKKLLKKTRQVAGIATAALMIPLPVAERAVVLQALTTSGNQNAIIQRATGLVGRAKPYVTRADLQSLCPTIWLVEAVINYYMHCLCERQNKAFAKKKPGTRKCHFFRTSFYRKIHPTGFMDAAYEYAQVAKWTRRGVPERSIFNCDALFFPCNVGALGTKLDHIGNPFGQIPIWSSL